MTTETLADRLKRETAIHHEQIEGTLGILLTDGLARADYRHVVARFYGFFRVWEERAAPAFERAGLTDFFDDRRKVAALYDDLRALDTIDGDIEALESCPNDLLPRTANLADVLGTMYVMEGSTLGGQLIARHLERTLSLHDGVGYSYFRGAGRETMPRWQAFKRVLAELTAADDADRVVAAAADTFVKLRAWMDRPAATTLARADV